MLYAIIPDPDGPDFRAEICASTAAALASNVRDFIVNMNYGASDIGAVFNMYRDGKEVGTIHYNGSVHFNDPTEVML